MKPVETCAFIENLGFKPDEFDPDEWWRDLQDGKKTSKAADAKTRKKELRLTS